MRNREPAKSDHVRYHRMHHQLTQPQVGEDRTKWGDEVDLPFVSGEG